MIGKETTMPTPNDVAARTTQQETSTEPVEPSENAGSDSGDFPADTPRADMTPEEQSAYDKHQARQQSRLAKQHARERDAEKKRADDLAAQLEALRQQHMSDDDKAKQAAVSAARDEGALAERSKQALGNLARELRIRMPRLTHEQALEQAGFYDINKFLTADGDIDVDAVQRIPLPNAVMDGAGQRAAYEGTQQSAPAPSATLDDKVQARVEELAKNRS